MYLFIDICTNVWMQVFIYELIACIKCMCGFYVYVLMHVRMCVLLYVCINTCNYVFICIFMYVSVFLLVCMNLSFVFMCRQLTIHVF